MPAPDADRDGPGLESSLGQAADLARRLRRLLEDELQALRASDLDGFEKLQAAKGEVLNALGALRIARRPGDEGAADHSRHPAWPQLIGLLDECRNLHRRNETLIASWLETIRGALSLLQSRDPVGAAETYDRSGRSVRARQDLGWEDA